MGQFMAVKEFLIAHCIYLKSRYLRKIFSHQYKTNKCVRRMSPAAVCSPRPNKWVSSRPLTWPRPGWSWTLDTGVGGGVTFRHYSMFVSGTELPGPGTRGSAQLQSTCHCVLCNPSWSPDSLERILRLRNGVVLVIEHTKGFTAEDVDLTLP